MGYRSTFITDEWAFRFSDQFYEKYKKRYNFGAGQRLPISTKGEVKRFWDDLEKDLVRELKSQDNDHRIYGVWLSEDGFVTQVVFTKDGIFSASEWDYDLSFPIKQ